MGRPKGHRSPDYDDKREALARRVFECVMRDGATSLNAMAEHTGVSRPTLRHYFGDRDGAVRAALETAAELGKPHLQRVAQLPVDDPRNTLVQALGDVVEGWRTYGVGQLHHVGLKVGLEDRPTGITYVEQILEPLLDCFEILLTRLAESGAIHNVKPRLAALALVSPVALALLHQDGLGGEGLRPLDVKALVRQLVDDFCRAHGVDP